VSTERSRAFPLGSGVIDFQYAFDSPFPRGLPILPSLLLAILLTLQAIPERGCAAGMISQVFVDNHSIFDPEGLPEDARIRWAYEVANRVHMRTREDFIRGELLMEVGDCFDPAAARESARILRDFRFIANADVYGIPQPDGTVHLIADTRDEWSTKLTLDLAFEDGLVFEGGSMTEENLLGMGILFSLFYRERREVQDLGALVEAPRLLPGGWDARVEVRDTRVGTSLDQLLIRPFVAEEADLAVRQRLSRREHLFTFRTAPGSEFSHVLVPVTEDGADLSLAARFGRPGNLFVLGGGLSLEGVRFPDRGASIEMVRDGDFDSPALAPAEVVELLFPQMVERETTRLNLLMGFRRLHFIEWMGLDAIQGVQDVPFGLEANLALGQSIAFVSPGAAREERDTVFQGEVFHGRVLGELLVHGLLRGEGRRRTHAPSGIPRWGDVLAEAVGLSYWRPDPGSRHLLVARLLAAGGWRTAGPFQLTLGGETGVRGFRDDQFPGGRKVILSVEDRITLDSPLSNFGDLGMTLFMDAGTVQKGNVPFGSTSGFQAGVGAGLRVGFPAGSSSVIRFDVALPVTGDRPLRSPVFRISSREVLGLLAPLGSIQLNRSRRHGVATDFSGVATEPYRR
jgi:hypothetical protein